MPFGAIVVQRKDLRRYLHHSARVHTDHHADPAEGGVLLLIVPDVAQRRTPGERDAHLVVSGNQVRPHPERSTTASTALLSREDLLPFEDILYVQCRLPCDVRRDRDTLTMV